MKKKKQMLGLLENLTGKEITFPGTLSTDPFISTNRNKSGIYLKLNTCCVNLGKQIVSKLEKKVFRNEFLE